MLLIFSYSLNPDQARQNIGPDLDLKCFTLHVLAERFLENFILNKSTDDKKSWKITQHADEFMLCFNHIDLQDYKLILCMQGMEKWGVE